MADTYTVTGALAVVVTDAGETYVYRGGPVPTSITDKSLQHLLNLGLIAKDEKPAAAPVPDGDDPADDGEADVDEMNLAELREYAKEHDIDLGGATKKDEVLAAIKSTD